MGFHQHLASIYKLDNVVGRTFRLEYLNNLIIQNQKKNSYPVFSINAYPHYLYPKQNNIISSSSLFSNNNAHHFHSSPRSNFSNTNLLRNNTNEKVQNKDDQLASKADQLSKDTIEYTAIAANHKVKEPFSLKKLNRTIKEEAQHYWHGTKLLGSELKISLRLVAKMLAGGDLTRREQRQLNRTTSDMARLVPFVIIVAIPFMELLFPVLLKLFPNMLPSTFESKLQEEEKKKKLLEMRMKMAKYLEETSKDVNIKGTSVAQAAKQFTKFFDKARLGDLSLPPNEVLEISRKFPDELTLSNLSRPQLVSMARYMNLVTFGTDSFLRHQIERRLKYLEEDDKLIVKEGVDNLSLPELQQICISRGIRTYGSSPYKMRKELDLWLNLHLKQNVPSSLLILSRAFLMNNPPTTVSTTKPQSIKEEVLTENNKTLIPNLNESANEDINGTEEIKVAKTPEELKKELEVAESLKATAEAITATLTSLPHQVVHEAQLKLSEEEGTATAKQKLNVIQEQEELIADELEQEEALEQARKAEKRKKQKLMEERKRLEEEEAAKVKASKVKNEDEKTKQE